MDPGPIDMKNQHTLKTYIHPLVHFKLLDYLQGLIQWEWGYTVATMSCSGNNDQIQRWYTFNRNIFSWSIFSMSVVTHAFNFSIQEAVAGQPLGLRDHPNLYSEFQDSQMVEAM